MGRPLDLYGQLHGTIADQYNIVIGGDHTCPTVLDMDGTYLDGLRRLSALD